MKREPILRHEFVEYIPKDLKDGTIYVSMTFATVAHRCCCGCGNEVITPLSPTDWKLTFDGETISLDPSVGNWNFDCQSHYWIRRNRVKWAPRWSREEINAGRHYDRLAKDKYFRGNSGQSVHGTISAMEDPRKDRSNESLWGKLKKLFS